MIVIAQSPQEIDRERRIQRLRLQPTTPRCSMEERQAQLVEMSKRAPRLRVVVGAISMVVEVPELAEIEVECQGTERICCRTW